MSQAPSRVGKQRIHRSAFGRRVEFVYVFQRGKVKEAVYLGTDRPQVLREAILCCRKGGTVSIPGVYLSYLVVTNLFLAYFSTGSEA